MRVDIYSDVVCPWCYIGKRRFEAALAERPDLDVDVRWRPFELDPNVPHGGADHRATLAAKFGGDEKVDAMLDHVARIADTVGLDYRWDRVTVRPNTRLAHALVWLAERDGGPTLAADVVERLFAAVFTEGRDVGHLDVLTAIAADAGIDPASAADELRDGPALDAVAAELATAHEIGVSAVPCFVFEQRWAVSGAQEPDTFVDVLDQVAAQLTSDVSGSEVESSS